MDDGFARTDGKHGVRNCADSRTLANRVRSRVLRASRLSKPAETKALRGFRWVRAASGMGLLNRYRGSNPYRGFESHPLRHPLRSEFLQRLQILQQQLEANLFGHLAPLRFGGVGVVLGEGGGDEGRH